MNSLKRKRIWTSKKKDLSGNTLIVTREQTQILAQGGSSDVAVSIELESEAPDQFGRPMKTNRRFEVDPEFIIDLTNAVRALRDANEAPQNKNEALTQIRYEMTSGLVVMLEIPAYDSVDKRKTKFVITTQEGTIRFVVGSTHDDLMELNFELEKAVTS